MVPFRIQSESLLGAQEVASGEVDEVVAVDEAGALRALASAGPAEDEDYGHFGVIEARGGGGGGRGRSRGLGLGGLLGALGCGGHVCWWS